MFGRAHELVEEFDALTQRLADPATHADTAVSRRVGRRYAELTPIVKALAEHEALTADVEAARELAAEDPAFGAEGRQPR
jgi:peptide chain release factor 1